MFQAHFDQLLNPEHELVILANKIDWSDLDAVFVDCCRPDIGAPAKAVRLMVGLHYLKYTFDESDESVVARWVENPYWQYFCGYTHLQHECPIHPTSMTKWLSRVGGDAINAVPAAAGSNLRKLPGLIRRKAARLVLALIRGCRTSIAWHTSPIAALPHRRFFHPTAA